MKCKKCGSQNVNVQAVTHIQNKHKGIILLVIYWMVVRAYAMAISNYS